MSFSLIEYINEAKRLERSPEFIEVTSKYAQSLVEKRLPVIFSLEHFAILVGVQSDYLRVLSGEPKNHDHYFPYKQFRYNYFKLKKRNGGYREIMAPSKELKYIQKWILENILYNCPVHSNCTGFQKNLSIYDNAKPHENSHIILKLDFLKFYDTITEKRIYGLFKEMGYAKNLAVSLAKLTTASHRAEYWNSFNQNEKFVLHNLVNRKPSILPQGSPSSPYLSNLVARKFDSRLSNLSLKFNCNYTRYADDITISNNFNEVLPPLKLIRKIITEEGFFINESKIRYNRKGTKQYVTGLTVTNGVNISKGYRKEISAHIYYSRKFGVEEHLKKISKNSTQGMGALLFHDWLFGHVCFIDSINKEAGKKLFNDFKKIDWTI